MSRTFTGVVVSIKMNKTVAVQIERRFRHPLYKKVITKHKKFLAHCENDAVKEGDTVTIQETRPISKNKHFMVIEKSKKVSK